VIAFHNPEIRVTVVDRDEPRVRRWNSAHPPIYEPGLSDVLRVARDGSKERQPNLVFTTDLPTSVNEADVVLIAVNTPTKSHGRGAGEATDMAAFEAVTELVARHANPGTIIVEKSTVPCRTAKLVQDTASYSHLCA
jgi:UDPglucose 6-dehydrogenase